MDDAGPCAAEIEQSVEVGVAAVGGHPVALAGPEAQQFAGDCRDGGIEFGVGPRAVAEFDGRIRGEAAGAAADEVGNR